MSKWKDAQSQVLSRLTEVRRLVDARDESADLALINQQDEFCDEAKHRLLQLAPSVVPPESKCHFCEGYLHGGGCMGRLDEIDRAVMHGEWDTAAKLVDGYIAWVRALPIS